MSKTTDALKVALDSIEGLEIDSEIKTSIVASVKTFSGVANSEAEVAREDLKNDLGTANKTIETLTRTSGDMKLQLENSGGEVDQKVAEKQLEVDNLTKTLGERDGTIAGYTEKAAKDTLIAFSQNALSESGLNFPRQNELFAEGLTPGTEAGKYFAKDKLGNTITAEQHRDNFLEEYKGFIAASGTDAGGTGTNTNTQTTSDQSDKKPAKIKDLIPSVF